jgi:hypothetical protein
MLSGKHGGNMSVELNDADHAQLDQLLGQILDWHKSGVVSRNAAIGAIAHVFAAAAKGNESEVHSWLRNSEVLARWKQDIGDA